MLPPPRVSCQLTTIIADANQQAMSLSWTISFMPGLRNRLDRHERFPLFAHLLRWYHKRQPVVALVGSKVARDGQLRLPARRENTHGDTGDRRRLVGSQIARLLVEAGETPVLMDAAPQRDALGEIVELGRVKLVEGDVLRPFALAQVIRDHDIADIVHTAANPMLTTGAQRDPYAASSSTSWAR